MNQELPQRDIVLLGAGHTHLHILQMWQMHPIRGVRLTCVSDQPDAAYSGMLPGTLAGNYQPQQARVDLVRRCAAVGARLILAETIGLDRAGRQLLLRDRPPLPYDWLSIGIGSRPASVLGGEHALSIKPIQTFLQRLDERLASAASVQTLRVVVAGGGAGGVEIAFCLPSWIRRRFPARPIELTLIHRGDRILTGGAPQTARRVQQEMDRRGYRTLLRHSVIALQAGAVVIEDHRGERQTLDADVVIWAVGAVGPALFEQFDLATDDNGFLLTDIHLRTLDDKRIFVVGDSGTCRPRPSPKAGVYAVRQGPVLWANLSRAMQGQPLGEWKPQSDFLSLLNTGDDRAILEYKRTAAHGRWCWWLKDTIDRRFMSKHRDYQPRRMARAHPSPGDEPPMQCDGCGGKLPAATLQRAIARLRHPPPAAVRLGLGDAEDVAAIDLAAGASVIATIDFFAAFLDDPYTVGRVAALNALSDLFAKGARATAALVHAVIPAGTPKQQEQLLYELLAGSQVELQRAAVPIVGGHTIQGEQTVIGLTLLGEHHDPATMRLKRNLRPGDRLVLTKPLGTGVLLAAHRLARCESDDFLVLLRSMLQSNHAAGAAADVLELHAATDVTGFGLLGHLIEMLQSSGLSARLDLAALALLPGTAVLLQSGVESSLAPSNRDHCAAWHRVPAGPTAAYHALFDPQTSGGLLLGVPEVKLDETLKRLNGCGEFAPAVIGRVFQQVDADQDGHYLAVTPPH